MTGHPSRTVTRHCDVAIVGGSAAGLAAALQLGRGRRSVIVVDAGGPGSSPAREEVRSHGGEILAGRVSTVTRADDGRFRLDLAGGHSIVARRVLAATGLVDDLPDIYGLRPTPHPSGLGDFVEGAATGETPVPGLYAAGKLTDPSRQALQAADDGSRVGAIIGIGLAHDDLQAAGRPSANEADWDHRYGGEQMWSGKPNGSLVDEVRGMVPGRVLDVGAGEGGDALWLAGQGWKVTASDISQRALDRIRAEAARRGLDVECHHCDANAPGAFGGGAFGGGAFGAGAFDLVSAQYASIPRTPDVRGVHNLLGAVAPGGTLIVVSHDVEPMRQPIDTRTDSRAFDPDAYLRTDDFAAVLAESPGWELEAHRKQPRPPGAASASHHVDDIVLRARRAAC